MTWVDDNHVGCSVGDAIDHGWCRVRRQHTCSWCGHFACPPPIPETGQVDQITHALELVAQERMAQLTKHGDAMRHLPDGTGPDETWLRGVNGTIPAHRIQKAFRGDYESLRGAENPNGRGQLTRMHLVREELAEAFECDPDSPEFVAEIIQVAALCVQWAEYKEEISGNG